MQPKDAGGHMYFIDYARTFIVLLVVMLHASLPYLTFVNYKWIIVDQAKSVLCDYLTVVIELVSMPVLFFISGYLTPPSLQKKGLANFVTSRLKRLGIPFAFGLCVLCPIMTYVRDLARGEEMGGYVTYWLFTYFRGKMYAGYLWFLSTLLIITLLFCLAYAIIPRLKAYLAASQPDCGCGRQVKACELLLAGLGIGACVFVVSLFAPEMKWVRIAQKGIISFQPVRLPVYSGFFLCGIAACRSGWRFMKAPDTAGMLVLLSAGSLLTTGLYPAFVYFFLPVMEASAVLRAANALLRAFAVLSTGMLLLGIFKKWFMVPCGWKDVLAANAYGIYTVHVPILVVLQYCLINTQLAALEKYCIVTVLGLPLSFAASYYIIRRLPVIGKYF